MPVVTMTGNKKRHGEQLVTMDQEESPDMVDEILGRRTNTRQQRKETQNEEENCGNKRNQSGNTKQKCKMATADREGKKRVPPPPSARVDESRIDEDAVAKLEKARLERLREESDEKKENKDNLDTANPKEEKEKGKAEQSQPLTPLVPREESPIGDGSTTEEVEDDKAEQCAAVELDARQTPPSQAWHRNTRPAEPKIPKQWKLEEPKPRLDGEQALIRLDQLAYLAMWMKEDDETRFFREGRQPGQEADIARLAREMQKTDQQLGQGATAQCIASRLTEWGYEEPLGAPSQETAPETTDGEAGHYK